MIDVLTALKMAVEHSRKTDGWGDLKPHSKCFDLGDFYGFGMGDSDVALYVSKEDGHVEYGSIFPSLNPKYKDTEIIQIDITALIPIARESKSEVII